MNTPGPWAVESGRWVRAACGRTLVAAVARPDLPIKGWEPEAEANARLIAAAPDMLEALRDAAFLLRKVAINPKEADRMVDSLNRCADDAVAACNKAEGRTP